MVNSIYERPGKVFIKTMIIQELLNYLLTVVFTFAFTFLYFPIGRNYTSQLLTVAIFGAIFCLTFNFFKYYLLLPVIKSLRKLKHNEIDYDLFKKAKIRAYNFPVYDALLIFFRWAISSNIVILIICLSHGWLTIYEYVCLSILFICNGIALESIFYFTFERALKEFLNLKIIRGIETSNEKIYSISIIHKLIMILSSIFIFPTGIMFTIIYAIRYGIVSPEYLLGFPIILISLNTFGLIAFNIKYFIGSINYVLRNITASYSNVSKGDFSKKIEIEQIDEFGIVVQGYNQLLDSMQDLFTKINDYALQLESKNNELTKMDKLKDEFLANTSHELRTPINGIIGITESLVDGVAGKPNTTMRENLQTIISSGKRLSSLINDLLDFSKLKNNDLSLQNKTLDMKQLAQVVLTVISSTVYRKNIKIMNEIDENTLVYGDENRTQQILYNLVGNAVKFTSNGYVKISSRIKDQEIEFCVEDTGIGIPEEKFEDIFKTFEQIDSGISRRFGGTGLGLSITKQLIELHGGRIWVESEVDVGSKFYFTMPKSADEIRVQEIAEEKPSVIFLENAYMATEEIQSFEEMQLADAEERIKNSNIKILVVDDEKINVQVLVNHLSLHSYSVETASNGVEALEKLYEKEFDLVLLDIMMPRMSGYEVCKTIREKYSIYELPVIMLTAKNQPQDIVVGFDVGANDYLVKPFEKNELLARAKTLLSLKRLVKEAIDNIRLANIDGLTGLNNRRHLLELAQREFEAVKRYKHPLSIMMIDIDHFKNINDTYGHDIGDEMLKLVARAIERTVRNVDISGITGRYGGEEFGIILRDTSIEGARIAGERIRKAVESICLQTEQFGEIKCTVSVGIGNYDESVESLEALFKKADNMLYRSKELGKNQVAG